MNAYSSCYTPIRRRIPWTLIRVAGLLFADEYRGRLFELLYRNRRRTPWTLIRAYSSCWTIIRRRIPWTLILVAGLLFADEYRGRLFELLDSYSPTNTADAYSSCCIVIADENCGRLFELLDSYSPTNTVDAYSSCWTTPRRRIPWTLIRVAGLLFADEYRGRLFELLYRNRRRILWPLIRVAGLLFADEYRGRLFELLDYSSPTNTVDAYSSCWTPIRRRIPPTLIRVAELLFANECHRRSSCCIVIADEYRLRLFELLNSYSPTNTVDAYSSCWTLYNCKKCEVAKNHTLQKCKSGEKQYVCQFFHSNKLFLRYFVITYAVNL